MNATLVGAFVIVLGALLVAVALWLAAGGAARAQVDLYLAIVDESVAGLNLNAPVKFNGVDVGKVREIRLDPGNPARVILTFAIERGTPVKADTISVLRFQGLTGIAYVELSGGAPNAPRLEPGVDGAYPVIQTKASLGARLENVLTAVLARLDGTTASVNALLSEANRAAFASTLADVAAVSRVLAGRSASIDAGIASAARTLDSTARSAERIGPVLDRIGRGADAVERMSEAAARASVQAEQTIAATGNDVSRAAAVTIPQLERLMVDLGEAAASVRRLSDETSRNPSALLFGRRPVADGPGESAGPVRAP